MSRVSEDVRDMLILGLGASGLATVRYCLALPDDQLNSITVIDGVDSERTRAIAAQIADDPRVSVVLGVNEIPGRFDLCVASPGIPPHVPLMQWAQRVSSRTISEIQFAFERSVSPWVAVTGTNGKTTTTALIAHLLTCGGVPAIEVGNIGTPAIQVVDGARDSDVLVAEVSSFQLSLTDTFHPRVAVLLNITPDHIDWHGSMEAYGVDKSRVFANLDADDTAVIDVDDSGAAPYADRLAARGIRVARVSQRDAHENGAYVVDGVLTLDVRGQALDLVHVDQLQIRGAHNVSNALAAAAAAHAMGLPANDIREGLVTFMPIEHRLEPAGQACGVEWFNDSKATNPDAVLKALTAFDTRPVILLLGGRNKGNRFTDLAAAALMQTRGVVIFGEAQDVIAADFETVASETGSPVPIRRAATMEDAMHVATTLAEPGDAVLLSPACASFDEFEGYAHRGREFKRFVASLECA